MSSNYIPYPDLDDDDFYKKIYHKKEFYDTKPPPLPDPDNQSDETMSLLFKEGSDFKLQSQQIFLKNFISEATPYKGVFIWHGTGTGKTCASIVIAERFHGRVEETGRKVLMIVSRSIQNEFYKTIFNFEKEASKKSSRQVVQCTGSTYKLGSNAKYLSSKKQEVNVTKMIKDIYEITTRDTLRNKLLKETGWDGNEDTINDNVRNKIKEIYSDRVIIVDEAHNRVGTSEKDNSIPTILTAIVSYADNIRLILMSATPMVNSPDDIIFPLNLLRLNDRRPTFKQRSIFKSNGDFTKGGESLLKEMCKGYISYIRGGDPPRFPYKLIAPESRIPKPKYLFNGEPIPESKKIEHTKVIECTMSTFQYNTYNEFLKSEVKSKIGGLLPGASQAGNIVFPSTSETYGVYGGYGYGTTKSDDHALNEIKDSRGNFIYQYSSFSQGFLLRENISKYSTKFAEIYDNIISSTGISYVYSQWVKGGMMALSLMFEENGFEPAIITGFEHIRFNSNTKKPLICYKCGKVKHGPEDHTWSSAKYVLLTGSLELSKSDMAKISGYINRKENMDGKLVKVLLGTAVSGEGIDFKRIRQVHILEPWFNQARLDQVEGRAIRNGSHKDLPPEQRNVEIFKYCIIPPKTLKKIEESIETIDEHDYRIIEDKDKQIKKAEYVLKESAIDCMLQRDNNVRTVNRTVKLEDSRGNIINYVTGDKPYSRECNYMKSCTYKCDWEPKSVKDFVINKSTYGVEFADVDIEKARGYIYDMYKLNPVIDVNTIFQTIQNENPSIEDIYIYLALESLMNKKGSYTVQDKYGRDGYLVERGDLYIYQPFELYSYNAPIIYKVNPLETKPEDVPFSSTDIKKIEIATDVKISGLELLNEYFKQYVNTQQLLKYYIKNIEKYKNVIIDIVVFQLSDIETLELLKYIVSPLYKKNKNIENEKFRNILINYYKNNKQILNTSKTLAIMAGNLCSQWGRSIFGAKKTVKEQWGKCDADVEALLVNEINSYNYSMLWKKVSTEKRLREDESVSRSEYLFILKQDGVRPEYIGTVEEKVPGGKKYLKILDFTKGGDVDVFSKRKELRGRVCTSLMVPVLKVILNTLETKVKKLNLRNIKIQDTASQKLLRPSMCLKIDFLFRLLNDNTDNVWFYKGNFSLDDMK
jgi:hypothetical protein